MKKPIALAASIIIIALVLLTGSSWYLPDLNSAVGSVALKGDGAVYLAENKDFTSTIFSIDKNASVNFVYWERSLKREERSAVTQLAYGNDAVYFVREVMKTSDGALSRWELVKLNSFLSDAKTIYTGTASDLPVSGSLSADNNIVYLTSVSDDGAYADLYAIDTSAEHPEPAMVIKANAPTGTRIVKAAYDNRVLYCILGNGLSAQYRNSGPAAYPAFEGKRISAISAANGCLWLYDNVNNTVSCRTNYLMGDEVLVSTADGIYSGAATSQANMVMLASIPDKGFAIVRYNGTDLSTNNKLTIPLKARILFKVPLILTVGVSLLVAAVMMLLVVFECKKGKRLAIKLTVVFSLASIVVFLLLSGIVIKTGSDGKAEARLAGAVLWADTKSNMLEKTDLALLSEEGFYGSESYTAIQELLTASTINIEDSWFTVSGELYAVNNKDAVVAVSGNKPYGLSFNSACDRATAKVISAALTSNSIETQTVLSQGRKTAICAAPVYSYGKITGIILSYAISDNLNLTSGTSRSVRWFLTLGGIITLLAIITVLLMALIFMRPLKHLINRMNDISSGRNDLTEVRTGKDEIGELWRKMQEMSISLAIKDYESNSMTQSFYRFVPRGLEKLLDRASIMEISLGDMVRIKNSIAIISVINRDKMRETLNDNQFLDFVNSSFSVISDNVSKHNGILLTGDFDLMSTKALFPNIPDDGIRFGLNALGDTAENMTTAGAAPELFILLHTAVFLYGIVGTEDRAFPFLSSSEMNLLSSCSGDFMATGTKMVVTDQFLKTVKSSFTSRYIGFVSSADGSVSYKLHEILDAYSDIEKTKRINSDAKFQEGIRFFYKNDFYLARNAFSAVLKTCPEDGIARWYLFACEHYFNSGNQAEIRYNLFGMKE